MTLSIKSASGLPHCLFCLQKRAAIVFPLITFETVFICLLYKSKLKLLVVESININKTFPSLSLSLENIFFMQAECVMKDSPNKLHMPKQMGEDQSDNLELNGPITLRILDGIAWDFAQAK